MANDFYTKYKSKQIRGTDGVDWTSNTIKAVLCTAGYTANINSHEFLSDVTGGARLSTATISTITESNGIVLVSMTTTFTSVTGSVGTQIVIYKHTGVEATSPLLILFDTFDGGMPVTPNGRDIQLNFNIAGLFGL